MTDLKIYEITDAVLDALDALEVDEETGEVLNPEVLAAVKVDAQVKITSTAKYVSMLECQEEQIKKAISKKKSPVVVTKRWSIIAFIMKYFMS